MLPKCSCAFAHALPCCTGGGGGHNNVPADFKTKVRKTTRCHVARGGHNNVPADFKRKVCKTLYRERLNSKLMIYLRSWQYRYQNHHRYLQTLGKLFKTKNADWKSIGQKSVKLKQMLLTCKSVFFLLTWHVAANTVNWCARSTCYPRQKLKVSRRCSLVTI